MDLLGTQQLSRFWVATEKSEEAACASEIPKLQALRKKQNNVVSVAEKEDATCPKVGEHVSGQTRL